MTQHSQHHSWERWPGWSTISASNLSSFTLWFTGFPGTGKTTLGNLVKKALEARGYKVELVDTQVLSKWLNLELQISEHLPEDSSPTIGYDAFITYICTLLARNGIISINTSISPYCEARQFAREQIAQFIEIYLHCSDAQRHARLEQQENSSLLPTKPDHIYEPPEAAQLSIDTGTEPLERSAFRVIAYLEQHGYIAPIWENTEPDEEIAVIKARLRALGYLE